MLRMTCSRCTKWYQATEPAGKRYRNSSDLAVSEREDSINGYLQGTKNNGKIMTPATMLGELVLCGPSVHKLPCRILPTSENPNDRNVAPRFMLDYHHSW